MKIAVKSWLSGVDSERVDHYSSTRGVLFYKGQPAAFAYHSKLTHRKHIVKAEGIHVPCSRKMNELPDIKGLVPLVQSDNTDALNHALFINRFPPIYLSRRMLPKDAQQRFPNEVLGIIDRVLSSERPGRYLLIKVVNDIGEGPFSENLGLQHIRDHGSIKNYGFLSGNSTYTFVYSTNDSHDYTLAMIAGVSWSIDLEELKATVLAGVNHPL